MIFGIDSEDNEVRGEQLDGARGTSPEGHLYMETVRLAMRPRDIRGVAIYPRHMASVEWGRVRHTTIYPQPS